MLSNLTMTIIGEDRPGLVQLVAERIAAHEGNWLESRMCRLGGQFAGIVRSSVPSTKAEALKKALQALSEKGLNIVVHSEGANVGTNATGSFASLDIVGHDRPGIVRQITAVLAAYGVNVEEFSSECVSAPMDGTLLFQARAEVLIPPSVSLSALRGELEKIASDLMVDVRLAQPAK